MGHGQTRTKALKRSKRADSEAVLELIGRISRTARPAGSRADASLCRWMKSYLESSGRFAIEERSFEFNRYLPGRWSLTVEGKTAESIPALCSVGTPRSGLGGAICRADEDVVRGKVALLNISATHESLAVEDLARRGALAVLAFQEHGPLLAGRVRYPLSSIPCMMITGELGFYLGRRLAKWELQARVQLSAKTTQGRGTNIWAEPRSGRASALFVAHHDSRQFSPGAIDNGSGTALLLLLAKMSGNPSYSILSTDAEEYGLLGSREFVRFRSDLDPRTSVMNLDSIGAGSLRLVNRTRRGHLSKALNSRISTLANREGVTLEGLNIPRGSDCDTFMEQGYRSCWLRSYPTPTATTVDDTLAHVQKAAIGAACSLLGRIVGSGLSL